MLTLSVWTGLVATAAASAESVPPATPGLVIRNEQLMLSDGGPRMGMMFSNIVEIANESGQDQSQVVLPVIPGYVQLNLMGGPDPGQFEQFEDRVAVRLALPAGESRRISVMYGVPSRLPHTFHRARFYRTERMTVAVPDLEMVGEVTGLLDAGTEDMGNGLVRVYRNDRPLAPVPDFQIAVRANVAGMRPYFLLFAALLVLPAVGLLAIGIRSVSMKRRARLAAGAGAPAPRRAAGKKKR